jgi:hypothetical protein
MKVELFANGLNESADVIHEMKKMKQIKENIHLYSVNELANQAIEDFTIRVIPTFSEVSVPLENSSILWQK